MTDSAPMPITQQQLDHLREAAREATSWDVVHRPSTASSFPARVSAALHALKLLERDLASLPMADAPAEENHPSARDAALLELQKNFRLVRSAIADVTDSPRIAAKLPRVAIHARGDEPRAAACAEVYLNAVDGDFSVPTFRTFVCELQTHEPLLVGELWGITSFLRFALLEALLAEAHTLLGSSVALQQPLISVRLRSLRIINHADWVSIIEPLIPFDDYAPPGSRGYLWAHGL